eukprot:6405991-Amphidinium_carterae.1
MEEGGQQNPWSYHLCAYLSLEQKCPERLFTWRSTGPFLCSSTRVPPLCTNTLTITDAAIAIWSFSSVRTLGRTPHSQNPQTNIIRQHGPNRTVGGTPSLTALQGSRVRVLDPLHLAALWE